MGSGRAFFAFTGSWGRWWDSPALLSLCTAGHHCPHEPPSLYRGRGSHAWQGTLACGPFLGCFFPHVSSLSLQILPMHPSATCSTWSLFPRTACDVSVLNKTLVWFFKQMNELFLGLVGLYTEEISSFPAPLAPPSQEGPDSYCVRKSCCWAWCQLGGLCCPGFQKQGQELRQAGIPAHWPWVAEQCSSIGAGTC